MESAKITCGGVAGMESAKITCGGVAGMESAKITCGGVAGMESAMTKAEWATAQPAIKAIRLTFMMIIPNVLLINAAMQAAEKRLPA
jgi:alanine dehydrogenase